MRILFLVSILLLSSNCEMCGGTPSLYGDPSCNSNSKNRHNENIVGTWNLAGYSDMYNPNGVSNFHFGLTMNDWIFNSNGIIRTEVANAYYPDGTGEFISGTWENPSNSTIKLAFSNMSIDSAVDNPEYLNNIYIYTVDDTTLTLTTYDGSYEGDINAVMIFRKP